MFFKNNIRLVRKKNLSEDEADLLMTLWNQEYPAKLMHKNLTDFEKYINSLQNPSHILLKIRDRIVGWASTFDRDGERWFLIILSSSIHRQGVGAAVIKILQDSETALNGWVIDHNRDLKRNGEFYFSPLDFYRSQGFAILKDQRLELPTISAVKIRWEKEAI